MRHLILALLVCTFGLRLGAAEQLITVTPQTLADWTVVGAEPGALASGSQLTLPAGAQLNRVFPSSAVILHLVSRPVLAETAADWPILEVGPVALALIGQGALGRLVLVVNKDSVIDLPWPVVTDQKNPAVDLSLAYDPVTGVGLIGLKDKLKSFAGSPSVKPVEVVLSAGQNSAWPQDLLSVLLLTDDIPAPDARSGGQEGNSPQRAATAKLKSALDNLLNLTGAANPTPGGSSGTAANAATLPEPVARLEIFTPPSVRRGRSEEVRAIIARTQNK